MNPTNVLSDIEKQAITIHRRIRELLDKDRLYNNVTWREVKPIQRITQKFLLNIENTKYDNDLDNYGDKISHVLKTNFKKHNEESPAIYLTWLSFGYHHIIRQYCPAFISTHIGTDLFYKKTLDMLLQ